MYVLKDKALVAVLVFVQIIKNLSLIPHCIKLNRCFAKQAVCVLLV